MSRNTKIVLAIIFIVIVVVLMFIVYYLAISKTEKYTIEHSGFLEGPTEAAAGKHVELTMGLIATDTDYSFYVEGVEDYDVTYEDRRGYVISFIMPENDVEVGYESRNTMLPADRMEE